MKVTGSHTGGCLPESGFFWYWFMWFKKNVSVSVRWDVCRVGLLDITCHLCEVLRIISHFCLLHQLVLVWDKGLSI